MLQAYIDESRSGDKRIFALGGWLCSERDWDAIVNDWRQRIEYETRKSVRKGFPAISRFHAADLSNLRGDFSRSKGWDSERQKLLMKKLTEILTTKRKEPVLGFSVSAVMDNWQTAYKKLEWAEKNVYHLCFVECAHIIGEAMSNKWPNEQVSMFHDHGPFNEAAQAGLRTIWADTTFPHRDFLVSVVPRLGKDCIALQPADLLAYEGQKAAHLALNIPDNAELQRRYRRSLQKLLGGKTNLHGLCFTRIFENILELRRAGNRYPIKTAVAPPYVTRTAQDSVAAHDKKTPDS